MKSIRKFIRQVLNEYLTRDEVSLKQYFSASDEQKKRYLPHEFPYFFEDFLIEKKVEFEMPRDVVQSNYEDEPEEEVDLFDSLNSYELIDWLESNDRELFDKYADYLFSKINDYTLNIPDADYPAWSYFDDSPEIVKNQWLIHFTDDADSIATTGFKYGVDDMSKLGLTTHLGEFEKKYGGYNFAYTLNDFYRYGFRGRGEYKYGKEAVIFKASGIKIFHRTDVEPQVIFYGNTATNIIPIIKGESERWSIRRYRDNRVFFESDDLREIVEWLVKNYDQYRRHLYLREDVVESCVSESDQRELGRSLSDQISTPYVVIYRAAPMSANEFFDRDYVTLSKKFAVEHAENNHVYHDEPFHVIQALVSTDRVFDAYNPGEYFYSGPNKKAKEIYVSKGEEFEGYDEINYEDCHIVVKLPSGMFLDSRGEQSEMDLIQDARFMNDVYKVTVEPISEEIALSTFSCQDQESEIRQVMDYIRSKNIIKEEVKRISEQTIDKLPNLSIGKTYEYNDLPEQIQDDIDVQFKIYGNDSEGDEWKLDGNPEDYQYHYILLPWKEIPKRLPLALGYIKKAHNSEYLQRIFKDIEQQGLQYPSVGEEGNHRGAYYYINKKDLPYLEIVQKKHFMNEADYTEINNNHKPLKKLLNSQEAYDILDSTAANGSTWTAGGCAILAFALNKAFGYPVYAIFDNDLNHVDHLVVKMPDGKFLDYDGANKNKLKSFKALEGLQGRNMSLIPFTSDMETSDIVFDSEASERLSDLIKDSGTINENRLNSDKYKGCSFSDLARMDLIDDFLKKSEIDPEYNLEDPELDWLLDAYEGYPDQVYIQNDVDNNRVVFWEGWSELCWEGLYAKPEYKGLSKEDSIKKIFKERIPRIAQEFEMKIVETDYFFHQTSDYSIDDGYIMRIVLSKKSQLSESVESDLEFQSQARRIYNKIVKNIDSVELKPLDEGDFVKTNKGIVQLEGVKFNLSQVDRNYNLDVYFARKFAKSNSIAHFDSKNNRLVFFILSDQDKGSNFETNQRFARLRFKSWVEPETFIHEFIHYLDSARYSQTYKFKTPQTKSDYYNSPEELNAFYHEIASNALKNRKSFDKPFKNFISGLLFWYQDFFLSLSDENKKKIKNRLYKLWDENHNKKSLNEEYYLDEENSLELAKKLQKKLKFKNLDLIGFGNNGFAYSVGDGKVMKVTTDLSEYAEAISIKGKKNKHLADVYAVYKLTGDYENIAVIILELLRTDNKNIEILEEELYSVFNEKFSDEFGYLSEFLYEYQRGMVPLHKINQVKIKLYSFLDSHTRKFTEQLFELVGELKKNSLTTSDFSFENLGYKQNGNLAYFDFGFGENVPTEFKSRLNIKESAQSNKLTSNKFTLDIPIIRALLEKERAKGKISAFENYAWRLNSIINSIDSNETLKVKNPKDGKVHEYFLADLYVSDLKKIEDKVNLELGKIRDLVGEFYYDSKALVHSLLSQEDFDADDIYPFPLYISANPNDSIDEVGIMIHGNGKYEMFEENEESSSDTDMIINKILGLVDKKQRVFAVHNEQLVDKIKKEKILPANLYITPYRDYAKTYWSSSEQRVLFSCAVKMSDIKMEGDADWRTIRETQIEDFKFLGNI